MTVKRKTHMALAGLPAPHKDAPVVDAQDVIFEASSLLEMIHMAATELPETRHAIQTTANLAIDKLAKAEDILDKYLAVAAKTEAA